MKNFTLLLVLTASLLTHSALIAGGPEAVKEYIKKWSPVAMEHMKAYGIPASIILAQAIQESASGNSRMARLANNHFGIKCMGWGGGSYYQDGNPRNSCYRKYECPEESYMDHARILTSKERYAFLFRLNVTDYKAWANGLRKAGYAMNPRYAQLLIKTIEDYKLYEFDILCLRIPEPPPPPQPIRPEDIPSIED